MKYKKEFTLFPCFYCGVDSYELKIFMLCTIGGLVLFSVFSAIGLYLKGYFKDTEKLGDYPHKIENGD
jgi:hypothetical protein